MGKVINLLDFKKKQQQKPEFKVTLSRKKGQDIQDFLQKINKLMQEIKEDAKRYSDHHAGKDHKNDF